MAQIWKRDRMIEKEHQPTEASVRFFIGEAAWAWLMHFESMLEKHYDLRKEIKFPFGNEYGWGFRYMHKTSLLLYVFFEKGGFCCTISIGDAGAPRVAAMREELLPTVWQAWENRYACGAAGGWVHYTVTQENELGDLVRLLSAKIPPKY